MSAEVATQIERMLGIGSMWVVFILGGMLTLYLVLWAFLSLAHQILLKIWHVEVMTRAYKYAMKRTWLKPPV